MVIELERQRALEVGRSSLVRAPAGSGKTSLLVGRYLALLASGAPVRSVLAITFTRKAAAEMRQRIAAALRQPKDAGPLAELAEAAAAACPHWRADEAWILTFDALTRQLVAHLPIAQRQLAESNQLEQLHLQAVRLVLRQHAASADMTLLLQAYGYHEQRLSQQLLRMLSNREQWLGVIGVGIQPQQLRAHIEAGWHQAGRKLGQQLASAVARLSFEPYGQALSELGEGLAAPLQGVEQWPDEEQLEQWQLLAQLWLTRDQQWRKKTRLGLSAGLIKRYHLEAFIQALEELSGFKELLADAQLWPLQPLSNEQWQLLQALLNLLVQVVAQTAVLSDNQQLCDYTDLALEAVDVLGEADAPSELMLRLDRRLEHVLVDEFQDCSHLNWQLLERLCAGFDGHSQTLMAVGDPMQSIYGFRGGDLALFAQAQQRGIAQMRLETLSLKLNFRSNAPLVDFVNHSFSPLFPRQGGFGSVAVPFVPSQAVRQAAAENRFWPDINDELLATLSAQLESSATVALLARQRTALTGLLQALAQRGYRCQFSEREQAGRHSALEDVLLLAQLLCQPADHSAWMGLLASPLVALDVAQLLALGPHSRLLDEDLPQPLQSLQQHYFTADALRQSHGLAAALRWWWLQLLGPAAVSDPTESQVVWRWFEAVEHHPKLDMTHLKALAENLRLPVDESAHPRLFALTIHQAKGLEFDHVWVLGFDSSARPDTAPPFLWEHDSHGHLLLAPLDRDSRQKTEADSGHYLLLQQRRKWRQKLEKQRLAYVAATRARLSLHWLMRRPNPDLPFIEAPKPEKTLTPRPQWPLPRRRIRPDVTLSSSPSLTPVALDSLSYEWVSELARSIGVVSHRLLEELGRQRPLPHQVPSALQQWAEHLLRADGWQHQELLEAQQRVLLSLQNTLDHPQGRWSLAAEHGQFELPLSGFIDGQLCHVRLDRLIEDNDGRVWVIDYKTSRHHSLSDQNSFVAAELERYRPSLELYRQLVMPLYPERKVEVGVFFTELSQWRQL